MSINEQSPGRSPPKLRVIEICVKRAALRGYIQCPFIKTNARACFGAGHCQGVPASRLALECHLNDEVARQAHDARDLASRERENRPLERRPPAAHQDSSGSNLRRCTSHACSSGT